MDGIYLDYAATSAVRPDEVIEAVAMYLRNVGATPGRAGHRLALDAGRIALRCRTKLGELFGADGDPGRVAFFPNATYALNAALFGLLRPGDRLVRTAYDHNAVRRPAALLEARGVTQTVIGGNAWGTVDLDEVEDAVWGNGTPARVLAIPHASNVLGTVLPVRQMADRAHLYDTLVVVDAAQSAGHVAVDVGEMGADVLAFTGHKGLLGPQGTGGVYVRPGVEIDPTWAGGTGGDSMPLAMPDAMPDRLEPGTLNGPGIAGLLAGVRFIRHRGVEVEHRREMALKQRLREWLAQVDGVRILSPPAPDGVGIVTIASDHIAPARLAHRLDHDFGVMTRAGLHCAPEAHQLLGCAETGAVRFSVGWATTEADVDNAAAAVASIIEDARETSESRRG